MAIAKATIHGAISIVNAIATGKGAALGISKKVNVEMETSYGKGVIIEVENKSMSSRLINKVIEKIVTKNELSKTKLKVSLLYIPKHRRVPFLAVFGENRPFFLSFQASP